ncbi:MAG: hypothetical protein Kow0074_17360 [Candidatus Zixiibacteriota bacterium]
MKRGIAGTGLALIACLAIVSLADAQQKASGGVPNLEGTWIATHRELPDGETVKPPHIVGLLTFRDGYRNFNLMWKDSNGNPFSISAISRFTISDTAYTEESVYFMASDGSSGEPPMYDVSGQKGSSPITKDGNAYTWKMPLFNEPSLTVEGDKIIAHGDGFVDHWTRVK